MTGRCCWTPRCLLIGVGVGVAIQIVGAESVDYFNATDKYTTVNRYGHDNLVRTAQKDLGYVLDAQRF